MLNYLTILVGMIVSVSVFYCFYSERVNNNVIRLISKSSTMDFAELLNASMYVKKRRLIIANRFYESALHAFNTRKRHLFGT